jgi:hypothetical protein
MSKLSRLCPLLALSTVGCLDPHHPDPSATDTGAPEVELSNAATTDASTGSTTDDPTTTGSTGDGPTGTTTTTDDGTTGTDGPPPAPELSLTFAPIKQLDLEWNMIPGNKYYRVFERLGPDAEWVQLGKEQVENWLSLTVPIHLRSRAEYSVHACYADKNCTASEPVAVDYPINWSIGYLKASTTRSDADFGDRVAISGDGQTLVIAASGEDGGAHGVNGNEELLTEHDSGAAYVFVRKGTTWVQQAYLKASNPGNGDYFGAVAISDDGNTIAIGAHAEDSVAHGVGGDAFNDGKPNSGAVYVFQRDIGLWSQRAYIKAPKTSEHDYFGASVALAADGHYLVVGAPGEDNSATGINPVTDDEDADHSGAVHVYEQYDDGWKHYAYLKASNTGESDDFGRAVAISDLGGIIAVGAPGEDSGSFGVDGDQWDDSAESAGAVYLFAMTKNGWVQQAYIKSSAPDVADRFGYSVALSDDGDTLAVGAYGESSATTGIDGDQSSDQAPHSGAAYVFTRADESWTQQAYIKAANGDQNDIFGGALALSGDGDMLVVGAPWEDGGGPGVISGLSNKSMPRSGAAYVFTRTAGAWQHTSYVKALVPDIDDDFGRAVALADDGRTLLVGAPCEQSLATGVGGQQTDDSGDCVGAAYLY